MNELLSSPLFWMVVSALTMPVTLWLGLKQLAVARAITDTPTSRIRSAAQGYVAVAGQTESLPDTPKVAPLTQLPSVWWFYEIEKRERDDDERTTWGTVSRGTSDHAFLVRDDTAFCQINPDGAKVYPVEKKVWYGSQDWPAPALGSTGLLGGMFHRFRYTEHRVATGSVIHVMGEFRTEGNGRDVALEHDVSDLLRRWKSDQQELLKRFDANKDGVINAQEWDEARRVARDHMLSERANAQMQPATHVITRSVHDLPFLIAATDPKKLASRARWLAAAAWLGFVGAAGLFTWALMQ